MPIVFRIRLVSLAAQKFISDIANDALQHCKMKGTASGSSRNKTKVGVFLMVLKHNIGYTSQWMNTLTVYMSCTELFMHKYDCIVDWFLTTSSHLFSPKAGQEVHIDHGGPLPCPVWVWHQRKETSLLHIGYWHMQSGSFCCFCTS